MIFNFSYFIGIGWIMLVQVYEDLLEEDKERADPAGVTFYSYYNLKDKQSYEVAIISVYFAFTSLSTVGLGDYCPRSDHERLIGAFMLLFGVLIFSYCMGKFIEMSNQMISFNQSLDDGDNLAKFFGVLKRFNNNKPFNIELKKKIEDHFDYKWNQDKNQAITTQQDRDMYEQIPEVTQDQLLHQFLFHNFKVEYRKYFTFEKISQNPKIRFNFYNWKDQIYRNFMTEILMSLEPRREMPETILFNELDDFTEIMFFSVGKVDIGFEINRKKMYCLRKQKSIVIADHGCTFNHKSNFIYKTKTQCEGYSIRKLNW